MERIEELDETSDIQAVVAAVRNRADEIRGNLGPKNLWEERVERADELMEIADRIEASAKRDGELLKANIASVRELEGMLGGAVNTLVGCAIRQKKSEAEAANVAKLRAAVEGIEMMLGAGGDLDRKELAEECARAIASPPRNCDRFATADEAREAWWREEILPRVHGQKAGVELAYHKWLFAPAEQEGCRQ